MNTTPTVTPELKALLRRVKLGRCLDTLPERRALAHTGQMGHAEFLELSGRPGWETSSNHREGVVSFGLPRRQGPDAATTLHG